MNSVEFISLEEDDKDIIISFVIKDDDLGVKSLILHRTLFMEEFLEEKDKGVKVSLEGDYFEKEDANVLTNITINKSKILISSLFREYDLDVSKIPEEEMKSMFKLLDKQNYDNRFKVQKA